MRDLARLTRLAAALAVVAVPVVAGPLSFRPVRAQAAVPTDDFVRASGSQLAVNGKEWTFAGYNLPCAQPFQLDAGQLGFLLTSLARTSGANAIRVWFFQENGGPGNWDPFDRVIAAAKAAKIKVIATLVNEWPACEPVTATNQPRKTVPWYQGGYKDRGDGYPLSFRDYATQVAAHYANEPTVAFWQLVNEAEAPGLLPNGQFACDESGAARALRAFGDDMATALHGADPHHLVNLGTLGGSQCGLAGADYASVHGGAIDLCEYHDYGDPHSPLEVGEVDGLASRVAQCNGLPGGGKPVFVGEAGIVANVQAPPTPTPASCTPWPGCSPATVSPASLSLRASLFTEKLNAAFAAGVVGYQIWFKGSYYNATNDSFAIGAGDPSESAMRAVATRIGTTVGSLSTSSTVASSSAAPPISGGSAKASTTGAPSGVAGLAITIGGVLVIVIGCGLSVGARRRRR